MKRREFIAAVPAASVAACAPAAASAAPISPMRALYHQWRAAIDAYNNHPDSVGETDEGTRMYHRIRELEDRASAYDPKTVDDLALMIVIADDGGDMDMTVNQDALAETAYRITGVGPRR